MDCGGLWQWKDHDRETKGTYLAYFPVIFFFPTINSQISGPNTTLKFLSGVKDYLVVKEDYYAWLMTIGIEIRGYLLNYSFRGLNICSSGFVCATDELTNYCHPLLHYYLLF